MSGFVLFQSIWFGVSSMYSVTVCDINWRSTKERSSVKYVGTSLISDDDYKLWRGRFMMP